MTTTQPTITLDTFRAWLSGVEEMSDDDWHPNKTQWDRIRSKIDLIVETKSASAPMPMYPPGVRSVGSPAVASIALPPEAFQAPREIPGMVSAATPDFIPPPSRMEMPAMMPPSTPVISGSYKSSFV
jgi:hypothetical protein